MKELFGPRKTARLCSVYLLHRFSTTSLFNCQLPKTRVTSFCLRSQNELESRLQAILKRAKVTPHTRTPSGWMILVGIRGAIIKPTPPWQKTGAASDLQAGEEGEQGVHPGACGQQGLVDVYVQQQRRLTDVLHYRRVVLKDTQVDNTWSSTLMCSLLQNK